MGRWFLDADDDPDYHKNLLLLGPFTIFLEICMQIYSVLIALSRKINKQKACKNN